MLTHLDTIQHVLRHVKLIVLAQLWASDIRTMVPDQLGASLSVLLDSSHLQTTIRRIVEDVMLLQQDRILADIQSRS